MLFSPSLVRTEYLCNLSAIAASSFTVRIHAGILEKKRSWAKLWYFLRGLDPEGSGYGQIGVGDLIRWLGASESTIYQWLREAKRDGAVRRWVCRRGVLYIRLGGLRRITRTLNLSTRSKGIQPWGVCAVVSLFEIHNLRALATAATAQRLQQLARFAAWRSLPKAARRAYKLPQPEQFFPEGEHEGFSHGNATGNLPPCVLHIGKRRVFVSKGYVPFGTSQSAIAVERSYCDRTVQRHLKAAGMDSRQVVQQKAAYRRISQAMDWEGSIEAEENICLHTRRGEFYLTDQSGKVGKTHTQPIKPGRIFKYADRYWLYRTNLYSPLFELCTLRASRRQYDRESVLQQTAAPGDTTVCIINDFIDFEDIASE